MSTPTPTTLDEFMALDYPMQLIADPEGGYVVVYPDLPGCMTQVETLEELPAMANDARSLWIEGELAAGREIPLPSHPAEYSGTFIVRVPRSLHRSLVTGAEREGASLNQYVLMLLSRGDEQRRVERRLDDLLSPGAAIGEPPRRRGRPSSVAPPPSRAGTAEKGKRPGAGPRKRAG